MVRKKLIDAGDVSGSYVGLYTMLGLLMPNFFKCSVVAAVIVANLLAPPTLNMLERVDIVLFLLIKLDFPKSIRVYCFRN
jgi:hypothetical protein